MKTYFRNTLVAMAAVSSLALSGCGGGGTEETKFVENWKLSSVDNKLAVTAVFNQSYSIDGEAMIQFKDYGSIYIGQTDDRRFQVSLLLEAIAMNDITLQPVTSLPTGFMFPSIVDMPMYMAEVLKNDQMRALLYFGYRENPRKILVALAIEFRAIGNNFPVLSLTQNYFNNNNVRFASFTLYGPKLSGDNKVLVPGGLFLAADVSQAIDMNSTVFTGKKLSITGPAAPNYQDPGTRRELLKTLVNELTQKGVLIENKK